MRGKWYCRVPKEPLANLKFRRSLLKQAEDSESVRQQLRLVCADEPLFMLNAIAWIFEPRSLQILPFITYKFQDVLVRQLHRCVMKGEPMAIVKARDLGASWLCVFEFFHNWLFRPMSTFLMGSRTQAYVDDTENPKSLFWKWDFLYNHLPWW